MSRYGIITAVTTLAACTLILGVSGAAVAKPRKKDAPAAKPGVVTSPLRLSPKRLRFGQSRKKVAAVYDSLIESDFRKQLQKAAKTVRFADVVDAVHQAKQAFRRSYAKFDGKPTSLDGTRFEGEYAHHSGEGYMYIKRRLKHRYLFFSRNRLWKVVDVYKLGADQKWGIHFAAATARAEKKLAVPGRRAAANPDHGQDFDEVNFDDGKTLLRLVDWEKKLAVAYVDRTSLRAVIEARQNAKIKKKPTMDPGVKGVLRDTSNDVRRNPDVAKKKKP